MSLDNLTDKVPRLGGAPVGVSLLLLGTFVTLAVIRTSLKGSVAP